MCDRDVRVVRCSQFDCTDFIPSHSLCTYAHMYSHSIERTEQMINEVLE